MTFKISNPSIAKFASLSTGLGVRIRKTSYEHLTIIFGVRVNNLLSNEIILYWLLRYSAYHANSDYKMVVRSFASTILEFFTIKVYYCKLQS